MPQEGIAVRTFFSFNRLSFPTIKNYLTFSVFLFISGFYYYYRIFNAFKAGTVRLLIFIFYLKKTIGSLYLNLRKFCLRLNNI